MLVSEADPLRTDSGPTRQLGVRCELSVEDCVREAYGSGLLFEPNLNLKKRGIESSWHSDERVEFVVLKTSAEKLMQHIIETGDGDLRTQDDANGSVPGEGCVKAAGLHHRLHTGE